MPLAPEPTPIRPERPKVAVTAVVDGREYPLRPRELNSLDIGALRSEAGATLKELFTAMYLGEADIDTVAQIVFLSRRSDGQRMSYESVAEGITQAGSEDGLYRLVFPEPDPEDAAPSATASEEDEVVLDPPD